MNERLKAYAKRANRPRCPVCTGPLDLWCSSISESVHARCGACEWEWSD